MLSYLHGVRPAFKALQLPIRQFTISIPGLLPFNRDRFQGAVLDGAKVALSPTDFSTVLQRTMDHFKEGVDGKTIRHVWFTVPTEKVYLVPPLVEQGFEIHSASRGANILLSKWMLDDCENLLPTPGTHQVGIGSVLFDEQREHLLVVQENNGPLRKEEFWKIPTGGVEENEDISEACCREVR